MKVLALACALITAAAPSSVTAQAPRSKEAARDFYERGTAAYALGRYDEAATLYEQAFEAKMDAALLYNAAQAHRLAGNRKRALELYSNYVKVFPTGAQREEAARHAATLRAALAAQSTTGGEQSGDKTVGVASSAEMTQQAAPSSVVAQASQPAPLDAVVARAVERDSRAKAPSVRSHRWTWIAGAAAAVIGGAALVFLLGGKSERNPQPTWGRIP